jgi:hypothetical protein
MKEKKGEKKEKEMESVVLALSSKYFVFASTCWQLCFWHSPVASSVKGANYSD